MNKIIFTLCFLLISTSALAEQWIECINTTIGPVTYENPIRRQGDCLALGLCSGNNNTGLATNVFEAVGSEWNDASTGDKKCDRLAPAGSRIISLTLSEITDIANALANQLDSQLRNSAKALYDGQTTEGQSLRCMAKVLIDELNVLRTWNRSLKTETAAAANLTDFKARVATLSTLNDRTLSQAQK